MKNRLALQLAYISVFSLVVAIVDTKPFDEPGFEKIQRIKKCDKGYQWEQSTRTCVPKR